MFGNKKDKAVRQDRIVDLLRQHPQGLLPAELAALLAVPRSTVVRTLPSLEDQGILLQEADGKLSIFDCTDQ